MHSPVRVLIVFVSRSGWLRGIMVMALGLGRVMILCISKLFESDNIEERRSDTCVNISELLSVRLLEQFCAFLSHIDLNSSRS